MRAISRITGPATAGQLQLGITIIRVVTGLIFAMHGGQKLFVYGLSGVSGAFAGMGIPLPGVTGPLVALLEFFGGLALVFGLLTRLAALGLVVNMLGALFFVHIKNGFFLPNGFEYVLALIGTSATLVLTGAGPWSVDAVLAGRGSADRAITTSPSPARRAA